MAWVRTGLLAQCIQPDCRCRDIHFRNIYRPNGLEQTFDIGFRFFGADGGAAVRRLLGEAGTEQASIGTTGTALSAAELDQLLVDWYSVRTRMQGYFDEHDVILCPVNAKPAIPHGTTSLPDYSYTLSYNVTGWPGAVVRAGTSPEGLPIGIQVVTAPAQEHVALAVAAYLERELGGFEAPPI